MRLFYSGPKLIFRFYSGFIPKFFKQNNLTIRKELIQEMKSLETYKKSKSREDNLKNPTCSPIAFTTTFSFSSEDPILINRKRFK